MNYEKFNDMMCKIRQAEEEFNKKLLEVFKPFADEMNKQQKEDNDDYYKGLKDMHEAVRLIATDGSDGGMSILELKDAFGTASVCDIVLSYSPMEIIDKTLAWTTKRKESQEFHVGDEIICVKENCRNYDKKLIYLGQNGWRNVLCRLEDGEMQYISNLANYRKTGKHYNINF